MPVYLSVYAVLALVALSVRPRLAMPWLLGGALFLWWFMGARYEVGCDFGGYLYRYENIPYEANLYGALHGSEPGFQLLITAVKLAGLDYMWLNLAATAIMLGCILHFLRAMPDPLTILALLFPVMIVQLGMSGIRQGIAASMLMAAAVPFLRGSRLGTAGWIVLGMQFHASVIMFLPIALVAGRQVHPLRLIAAVGLLTPVAALLLADRLEVYQDRYIDQVGGAITSGGGLIRFALILIPALFFVLYRRRLRAAFPEHYDLTKLYTLISFALIPVAMMSSIILHRLNYYVMPFSIVTFVLLARAIFPPGQRLVGRMLPMLVYGVYSVSWFLTSAHAQGCYVPYRNYLLGV